MASTINAQTTPFAAVVMEADGTGNLAIQTANVTAISIDSSQNVVMPTTGSLTIPSGTTAERPVSPATGMIRYNTTESALETYIGTAWVKISTVGYPYSVEVLLVAGGGGGTLGTGAGGSGGGGYLEGSMNLAPTTAYSVTVGAGGAAGTDSIGSVGGNTVFNSATALGGGVGSRNNVLGLDGGSGGGAGGATSNGSNRANTAATQGNSGGLTGYGNTGGNLTGSNYYAGSGGGGAGGVGGTDLSRLGAGGTGGAGRNWQSLGTSYAGGGGGGSEEAANRSSASAGGGQGGSSTQNATAGTANTGGGAGGAGIGNQTVFPGGSGIVIIRYLGAQRGTGGTVTSAGGYTYHTFTSSGTYTA